MKFESIVELRVAIWPYSLDGDGPFFNFKLALPIRFIIRDSSFIDKSVWPHDFTLSLGNAIDNSPFIIIPLFWKDDTISSSGSILLPITFTVVWIFLVEGYRPRLHFGDIWLVGGTSCLHAEVFEIVVLNCAFAASVTHWFLFELIKTINYQGVVSSRIRSFHMSIPIESVVHWMRLSKCQIPYRLFPLGT